jgi:succinate dehydrogenase/fumarate reductase cytochrome b subunit
VSADLDDVTAWDMDALTSLVLFVTFAAVVLHALYGFVLRAIRDEITALGGREKGAGRPSVVE